MGELRAALTVGSFGEILERARELNAQPAGAVGSKGGRGSVGRPVPRPGAVERVPRVRPKKGLGEAGGGDCATGAAKSGRVVGGARGSCTAHEMPYPSLPTLLSEPLPDPADLPAPMDAGATWRRQCGVRRCERPPLATATAAPPPPRSASGISREASRKFISRAVESPRPRPRMDGGAA